MYKKIFFKIHLYLGLTAGIVLMVIGITGAILSFKKEILWLINKDSYIVKIDGSRLSEKEIIDGFKSKFPEAIINSFTIENNPYSSVIINIIDKNIKKISGKGINYYINPYTLELLPKVEGNNIFKFIENIHRKLLVGEIGKQIIGASTLLLLVLIISGVYIYLPRLKRAFFKSFTFNFKDKGRYFLSTIHSSLGMWVIPFFLLTIMTGLYWSYHWYNDTLHRITGIEKKAHRKKPSANKNQPLEITSIKTQRVFNLFRENITDYSKVIFRFKGGEDIYVLNYLKKDPIHYKARNEIILDIKNNKIIKHKEFSTLPLKEKLMKSILPLHSGEYFGVGGQLLMFLSSLSMSLFTITGFMMYLKKRKRKEIKKKRR